MTEVSTELLNALRGRVREMLDELAIIKWRIVGIALLVLVGSGIWGINKLITFSQSVPPPPSTVLQVTTSLPPPKITVFVSGAVYEPGIIELPSGSRANDAIKAAGGSTNDADFDRMNLAARINDGQHIAVPRKGQPAIAATNSEENKAPININVASLAELDSLPGVGVATAQLIVDYRTERGPFKSIDDLGKVKGIGPAKLAKLRPLIAV